MPLRTAAFAVSLLTTVLVTTLPAYYATLDRRTLEQAVAIGQSRLDAERAQFHRPYRVDVMTPPLDYIDVVTPFRRVALTAEARGRAGNRLFGQSEALAALGDAPDRVDIVAELTFHPLNTFIGVPGYDLTLTAVGRPGVLQPREIQRVPRYGPRIGPPTLPYPYQVVPRVAQGSEPLTGGTIVAAFDGVVLTPTGSYTVTLSEGERALAAVRVDLARLR